MYKSGDLLLFIGNGKFSKLITLLPGAKYSHVGMVYNHPGLGLCVWESTSLGTQPDLLTGELVCGCQLVDLHKRIDEYDGEVYHRPLNRPLNKIQQLQFDAVVKKYHGVPYEKDNRQLYNAEVDIFPWNNNEKDESSLFCSEIATITCRKIWTIPHDGEPANEKTPTNLSEPMEPTHGFEYIGTTAI